MRRLSVCLGLALFAALAVAPAALGFDAGEGWYGETNDKAITNAGFVLIAAFPVVIFILSMLQITLDRRKEERKKAEKRRKARAEWRGGW